MSFLTVFIPSLVLTAIIGGFLALMWRIARKTWALSTFWGIALIVHVGWLAVPHLGSFSPFARWLAILWMGDMLAAITLLIPFALLSAVSHWRNIESMSIYLPAAYLTCVLLAGLILSVTSTAGFVVREETVRIPGLPPDLDGFRIANLGDVHIGRFIDAKELNRGISAINERKVDLLVVTGDLVDDITQIESTMEVLEQSEAPYKTVAILGNHEEMGDLPKILSIYGQHKSRITLLVNENIAITRGAATLHIVGVDFPMGPKGGRSLPRAGLSAAMGAQADAAFTGLVAHDTILALSHHPAFFPFAVAHGAQLTLASHTHGGQLRAFGRTLIDAFSYVQGPYRLGRAYLDVSAGFGSWLPIRFGVPREIVIITLRGEPER